MRFLGLLVALLGMASGVRAGSQEQESLSDSVRTALSVAVSVSAAAPQPVHASAQMRVAFQEWLEVNDRRLAKKLRSRQFTQANAAIGPVHELDGAALRREFLQTVWYESQRAGLEPSLVLGLIQVESGFRKFAISTAGARGYMQVMPFWPRQLGNINESVLFQMQANLRFGCVILRHYLEIEKGDLNMALGRYNGSRGQLAYPNAVLVAKDDWQ
jgi:soluble lytic murein transglycosylase-like protein